MAVQAQTITIEIHTLWVVICSFLVFIMQAGFLALETGMTRNKNNIDVAMKNIIDFTVSTVFFLIIGFPIMFGVAYFGRLSLLPDLTSSPDLLLKFLFQVMFCGTTITIISGAIAERTRFQAYVIITIFISAFIYPIFGQWVWATAADGSNAGWLAQQGFYDFAGSTVVHSVGGWAALALIIVVGSRTGRFDQDGTANVIPRSNLPLVIIGVLFLWFGWFGFNGGSGGVFDDSVLIILFNTLIGGSIGGFTGYLLGIALGRHGDIEFILNGVLAGLVAVTAGANVLSSVGLIVTVVVGVLIYAFVSHMLERFQLDDVVGAIPVHLGAGIWGTLAVGLFGNLDIINTGLSRTDQIMAQVFGIIVCGLWSFITVYVVMRSIDHVFPLRVSEESERIGLNISEHGARTDIVDLLDAMQEQASKRDFSIRAPVEPFTELGRVASYYNLVMDSLEDTQAALLVTNDDLETQIAEVNRVNKKISTANEQIKNFANILSHDLRTPITSVRGLVSEIQYEMQEIEAMISNGTQASPLTKEAVQDFIPESLRMIDAAIEKMDTLTKQILIIAKDESRPYNPAPLEMTTFIQQLIDAQGGIIRQKGIQVTLDDLPQVTADEIMMQQVFSNLISNAVKYLDPTRTGKIHISGRQEETSTVFSIQDNGLGIPEAQKERVFQLFRRVGKHENIEGNGFGLFYIRGMLHRVDGDIWFESEEGIGTTFYVSLPKQPKQQPLLDY